MKKVITYGTFDLFHQGHLNLLTRARALGDYLIVGVTTEHFDEARGKINVVDSVLTRIENVKATGLADEIIIEDHEGQKIEDIQKYGIDIFTLGSDWVGAFDYLKAFCEVVYLERTPNVSSTVLRNGRVKIHNCGIIGTGRIAARFLREVKYVSGIEVTKGYNPVKESAQEFAEATGIEVESADLGGFLDGVDAVYIASPNETHYDYAKAALERGKHVLSEKPAAFTKEKTAELYMLAKKNGCVLLEGIRTAYCPGFSQLINVARSGQIGEIVDVEACFTRIADAGARERTDAKYGGAFLEFAPTTLLPIIKLLGADYTDLSIDSICDANNVDIYTKLNFKYKNAMATAKVGVGAKSEGHLVIAGTKGYILAESPWWLTRKFEIRYEDASKVERFEPKFQGDGFRYEISEFVSKINGTDKHAYKLTADEAIAMSVIVEKFMEKRGVL